MTGIVRTGGTEFDPQVAIRPEGAPAVMVAGGRAGHVGLLSGALVTVCGSRTAPNRIEPVEVELREVDGMTAYLGVLRRGDDLWEVVRDGGGAGVVRLASVPGGLAEAVGRTVWVAGVEAGDAFEVRSYGVLEGW